MHARASGALKSIEDCRLEGEGVMKVLIVDDGNEVLKLVREAVADMSFDQVQQLLRDELVEAYGLDAFGTPLYCMVDVFPEYLIARGPNEMLYQISYTIGTGLDDDGDVPVTLGDPVQVETAYVPVQQSATFVAEAAAAESGVYPVVLMTAGWAGGTLDGHGSVPHYFTPEVVAEVAQAANGAKFGRRHPEKGTGSDDPDRIAGWFEGGRFETNAAIANLHVLESETEMRAKLDAARKAGKLDLFGLSIYGLIAFKAAKVEGKPALVSTKLGKLFSVDLCAEAGAGGKFLYAASANINAEISAMQKKEVKSGGAKGAGRNLGGAMKDRILKVLEALRKLDAAGATELQTKFDALKEEQHADFLVTVTEAATAAAEKSVSTAVATQTATEVLATARESLKEAQLLNSKNLIERKLGESKLPVPAMSLVREHSMTKKALQDYAEVGMGGLDMVISKVSISDYKTQDRVRDGYFGDLATVAEAGPYTEFTKPTDEKIQYALAKRGNC
jgi:hypothetical protein